MPGDWALGAPEHVGHVVPDLEAAMRRYTDELGMRWASITAYGKGRGASRFTCSLDGPVFIELIQHVPGTIWVPEHGASLHHLAYWTDDFARQRDELVGRGLRLEASGPTFCYLRSDGGLRIELMDRVLEPAWNGWLAGGRLFA
jgi:catechol 2,3-dioxygenase-like lactoylglutathione lyase family enzyme